MLRFCVLSIFFTIFAHIGIANVSAIEYFVIDSFHANIDIHENNSVDIEEIIEVTFSEPRHGIFRDIPIYYKNDVGFAHNIYIRDISVTNHRGENRPFEIATQGDYLSLKIGDPNAYVFGQETYVISYRVNRAVRFFDDHDEFYWNITGDEWPVPIKKAAATITYPQASPSDIQSICYTGSYGSTQQECSITSLDETIEIEATNASGFGIQEGLTVAISIPKGIIQEPSFFQNMWYFLRENLGLALIVITTAGMGFLFYRFGRDPEIARAITAEYEPPDELMPGEMGTLIDERADIKDISSEIIYLAVHGYIVISEETKDGFLFDSTDYVLKKQDKDVSKLKNYQQKLLNNIFGSSKTKKISDLKNTFYTKIQPLKDAIYSNLLEKKYFPKNPQTIRGIYIAIGSIGGLFVSIAGGVFERIDIVIGGIISGIIIVVFGIFMPAKTRKGAETHIKVLGFKDYIQTAEKHRIEFQEKENLFETYLPYAMAFGVVDKWSEAFEGIYTTPPNWYKGDHASDFSTVAFAKSLNKASSTINSTMVSQPSKSSSSSGFGGGGFSGGGFGGGGGGSW